MNAVAERTAERTAERITECSAGSTALVCLAHGSRHPGATAAVNRISATVAELTGAETRSAYLDFSPRTLTAVAEDLRERGYAKVLVVPLLFTEAYHLRHDIPAALASAAEATTLRIELTPQVGMGSDVVALLASRIPSGTDDLIIYSVGSSVKEANMEVAECAARVGAWVGIDARVITATGPAADTGPQALLAAVSRMSGRAVHIAPLFISPGTLWDAARAILDGIPNITVGEPLDVAIAPVVAARVQAYRGDSECEGTYLGTGPR